jgi:AcrR family transcriptional regulator
MDSEGPLFTASQVRLEDLPHLKGMGRRQRRAAETRLRLFRCALQLFAERGFSNVTVEDITEAADVGKGTFFNYFAGKDHVLGVMEEIQLGKVREALEQAENGKRSVQTVLSRLSERIVEEPGRSPDLARAFVSSFLASEVVRRQLDHNMAEGRRMIAQVIEIGQRRGEIDSKLKKERAALLLQQTLMGTVLLWSLRGEAELQSAVGENFRHFWTAIAARNRAGKR